MSDMIYRQDAIDVLARFLSNREGGNAVWWKPVAESVIDALPPAQPEPLSDAYTKAVWTWLLEYQIKAAELKGRYTPYEVLSWVANDWRKEHERSD